MYPCHWMVKLADKVTYPPYTLPPSLCTLYLAFGGKYCVRLPWESKPLVLLWKSKCAKWLIKKEWNIKATFFFFFLVLSKLRIVATKKTELLTCTCIASLVEFLLLVESLFLFYCAVPLSVSSVAFPRNFISVSLFSTVVCVKCSLPRCLCVICPCFAEEQAIQLT